ncbi:protein rep [Gordonia polyisoprenivorans]|uniref:protein rep n=1 Tax=Gordonia polyisoprenivorans TaxID=84595 RepID=UPI001EE64BEF|nr:protein rep [Gordonia polyisoprenivorans]
MAARADARRERGTAREVARSVTRLDRVRQCGRPFPHGVAIRQAPSGSCSVAGVSTCGSVWVCPVCAHRIAVQRAMDLGRGIARWVAAGNSVILATFTVSHQRSDALADVWGALQTAQRRVVSGRAWQSDQAEYRIRGYHRTTECTLTWENGWHPHYHVLYFIDGAAPSASRLAGLKSRLFERWTAGLRRDGFDAGWEHGVDIRAMRIDNVAALDGDIERAMRENPSLAEYLTKSGARSAAQLTDGRRLALEALAHTGKGSQGGYTPFGLLGAIGELQSAADADATLGIESSEVLRQSLAWTVARWREWEKFSSGRRQVTMSRSDPRTGRVGLSRLLKLEVADVEDDALAESEPEQAVVVAVVTARDVRTLARRGVTTEHLAASVEQDGLDQVVQQCMSLGVELRLDEASIGLWEYEESLLRT